MIENSDTQNGGDVDSNESRNGVAESSNQSSFEEIVKNANSISALEELGFSAPSIVQTRAVPVIAKGQSVVVTTATRGAEKTLCYGLGIAESADSLTPVLVITEPAPNVDTVAELLSTLKLSVAPLSDTEAKPMDAQVVVGTSKMAFEAIQAGNLKPESFKTLVMDGLDLPASAPQMDQVSRSDVEGVLEALEANKQLQKVWLSETIPLALTAVVKKHFQTDDHEEVNDEESDGTEFVEHTYIEVGGDLRAKPDALCDMLEGNPEATCVIFCNSPSDADFVDVILTRRGISSAKLIGHVPPRKVQSAVKDVKDGNTRAIIATDVASRHIPVEDFNMVINHAIHSDPEVYIHRMGRPTAESALKTVLSVIGPTDVGNFHYLRKLVEFEFSKGSLPDESTLLQKKGETIVRDALASDASKSDQYNDLIAMLKDSEDLDKVLAFLLHNTLNVMPGLIEASKAKSSRKERDYSDYDDESDERSEGRRGRGRGRDRDRQDRGDGDDRGRNKNRGRDRDRERNRDEPRTPPKKDMRIYLGHGSKDGFSEEAFVAALKGLEDGASISPERFSLRDCYAFVDFPSEVGENLIEKLTDLTLEDGTPLTALKATLISAPREARKDDDDESSEESGTSSTNDESEDVTEAAEASEPLA